MAIWDDLRRGAQQVVEASQRGSRLVQLKAQLNGLEEELGDRIYDLGLRTLELHRNGELASAGLAAQLDEISRVQREVRAKELEIDDLQAELRTVVPPATEACGSCGRAVRSGDRFCPHCGADQSPTTER